MKYIVFKMGYALFDVEYKEGQRVPATPALMERAMKPEKSSGEIVMQVFDDGRPEAVTSDEVALRIGEDLKAKEESKTVPEALPNPETGETKGEIPRVPETFLSNFSRSQLKNMSHAQLLDIAKAKGFEIEGTPTKNILIDALLSKNEK